MKKISTFTLIISKIFEVIHWIGAAIMTGVLICTMVAGDWLSNMLGKIAPESGTMLSTYGFEISPSESAGKISTTMVMFFAIGSIIIMGFMAMIFRNIYLIVKKSNNTTPFQKDNVRMLKEIGIFSIAVPVVGLIISIIVKAVIGVDAVETSNNFDGFVIGIIALCLTQFFARGVELEADVEGLL